MNEEEKKGCFNCDFDMDLLNANPMKMEYKMISDELQKIVDKQAEDPGLWFYTKDIQIAYLQQELRKLHKFIENRHRQRI